MNSLLYRLYFFIISVAIHSFFLVYMLYDKIMNVQSYSVYICLLFLLFKHLHESGWRHSSRSSDIILWYDLVKSFWKEFLCVKQCCFLPM